MTETAPAGDVYVLNSQRVRESIDVLLEHQTHQFFIAYLYLRSLAAREGRLDQLSPSWPDLGEWLRMEGGPPNKPHLRPFWKGQRNAGQEWLASNLAGSYSPSSLRTEPLRVVQTDATGRFSLRDNHAELALEHLLFGQPLEAVALGAFLYRDYGLIAPAQPAVDDLVVVFRQDFGYDDEHSDEFETLYVTTWRGSNPWFEPWPDGMQG